MIYKNKEQYENNINPNNKNFHFERKIGNRIYYSQACQDLFVLSMLNFKKKGTYIEIGGAHPFESNNTYILEKYYNWSGFSVEYDESLVNEYNTYRDNICLQVDATKFDYESEIQKMELPAQIDYLSIDIDPSENTYMALLKLPLARYRFSVITYEHDRYTSGDQYMNLSRKYLNSNGYQLVVENVKCFGRDFEDWWVDPIVVDEAIWRPFYSKEIEFKNLF